VYRFLDRALFWLEAATITLLLLVTLARPTTGLLGIPTWGLVLVFGAYSLLGNLLEHRSLARRSFVSKSLVDLPVTGLVYFLAGEPGGPLFILFVLAADCAAASMTPRGTLLYTAAAVVVAAGIDLILAGGSPTRIEVWPLVIRLILLALVGLGMAVVMRRLLLEQEAARSVRDEAERLGELDRLRADFISSVSHDLRTPLTAARAGLGMLETGIGDHLLPDERGLLEDARLNVERLGLLIDGLLAYNQLEAGTLRLERQSLDLRAIALGAVPAVHVLIRQKGQELEVDLSEPLPTEGDPRRLEQVVVNLLANAHRHTSSGTRIRISGRRADGEVLLSVSDNGPGIPTAELEAVFERYHRTGSVEAGLGLGLTIAKGIVELHGGRIWAEGEPGRGATFHVALPRHENREGP
jgi:signal transduction histidine kinase